MHHSKLRACLNWIFSRAAYPRGYRDRWVRVRISTLMYTPVSSKERYLRECALANNFLFWERFPLILVHLLAARVDSHRESRLRADKACGGDCKNYISRIGIPRTRLFTHGKR